MAPFLLTLFKHSLLAAAALALAAGTKPLWRERYGARLRCALWLALAVFLALRGLSLAVIRHRHWRNNTWFPAPHDIS